MAAETAKPKAKSLFSDVPDDFLHGTYVASCHLQVRLGFIRKVYAIVCTQLLVTTVMSAFCITSTTAKQFVQTSPGVLSFVMILSFISLFALMAFRHSYPKNMILLGVFTIAESFLMATIVTFYDVAVVMQAAVLCLAVTLGLTVFTFQTTHDFTGLTSTLLIALWMLIGIGFVQYLFPFNNMVDFAYGLCGATLFSLFIVADTQMMLRKVSVDEYILCAINLYLDILNLFLYILKILNRK